jgi:Ca2+-dependent lipid-binding protein
MVAGNLVIKLRKAKLKRDTELFGSMDPYCEIKIGNKFSWKSTVINDGGTRPNFHL